MWTASLDDVLECLVEMTRNRVRHGSRVGIVQQDFGKYSTFKEGMAVIFETSKESGDLTVEHALTMESIEEQRKRGSLLCTVATTVGVPPLYVKPFEVPRGLVRPIQEQPCG